MTGSQKRVSKKWNGVVYEGGVVWVINVKRARQRRWQILCKRRKISTFLKSCTNYTCLCTEKLLFTVVMHLWGGTVIAKPKVTTQYVLGVIHFTTIITQCFVGHIFIETFCLVLIPGITSRSLLQ